MENSQFSEKEKSRMLGPCTMYAMLGMNRHYGWKTSEGMLSLADGIWLMSTVAFGKDYWGNDSDVIISSRKLASDEAYRIHEEIKTRNDKK